MHTTNILKKTLGITAIVLLAAACNAKSSTGTSGSTSNPDNNNQSSGGSTSSGQAPQSTYTNSQFNFMFNYPDAFTQVTPTYGNLKNQIIQVQLGNTAYPKTNFGDADFTVSQQATANLADCLKLQYPAAPNSNGTNQKTINGVTYTVLQGADAGAGNFYNSTIYRTYTNSNCFELTQTIHTGDIGNYPSGTAQVDTDPIQTQLDQMLNSFMFMTAGSSKM